MWLIYSLAWGTQQKAYCLPGNELSIEHRLWVTWGAGRCVAGQGGGGRAYMLGVCEIQMPKFFFALFLSWLLRGERGGSPFCFVFVLAVVDHLRCVARLTG